MSASVLAVVLAACGGGGGSTGAGNTANGGTSGRYASGLPVRGQKKGATLKFLSNSDFDHLDPGAPYYELTYVIRYSLHRPLYFFKPRTRCMWDPSYTSLK